MSMNMSRPERDARGDLTERVVSLNRVAKVVKGGRRFSFSALVVVGDGAGRVDDAKKHMIRVPMVGRTIPHQVLRKQGAAKVLLRPASPGTGVISGGAMRHVVELAGIKDILTKSQGTDNPINTVRATMAALRELRTAETVARLRGKTLAEIGLRPSQAAVGAEEVGPLD